MARPNKNNLEYFTHDASMRNDRKIKAVRAKYGITGYAVYNMLLETLCESNLLIINLSDEEIELVSGDLTIVSEELILMIDYFCKIGLLNRVKTWLFCPELDKRAKVVFDKRTKDLDSLRRENGIYLSENYTSPIVSVEKSTQSKVKESKEKKSKEKKSFSQNKSADYIDQIIDRFVQVYGNYKIISPGKERGAAGKILKIYKQEFPDSTANQTLDDLEEYFELCVNIDDPWLRENMSLPVIVNQFNKINKILRDGKSIHKKGATPSQIAEAIARNFAIDYEENS